MVRKVPKMYAYINSLQRLVVDLRLNDKSTMKRKRPLAEDDPRRLRSTIMGVEPRPVSELAAEHISRFGETRYT